MVLIVSNFFVALVSAVTEPTSIRKTTLATDEYDEHRAQQTLEFLREYFGEDCDGLVTVDGITYRIVDIGCACCNRTSYTALRASRNGTSSTRTIGARSTQRTSR